MNCPQCGKPLVERTRHVDGGKFIGCSGFPKCHYVDKEHSTPFRDEVEQIHDDVEDLAQQIHAEEDAEYAQSIHDAPIVAAEARARREREGEPKPKPVTEDVRWSELVTKEPAWYAALNGVLPDEPKRTRA